MAKLKVAVLFGGASKDHSVSLQSAYSVLCGLSKSKYEVIPIGITKVGRWLYYPGGYEAVKDGTWETDSDCCPAVISPDAIHHGLLKFLDDGDTTLQRIDVVFSVVHGKYGECGRIQGLCKLAGIQFVGGKPDSANACMDKMLTHLLLDKAGVKTIRYHYFERADISDIDAKIEKMEAILPYPVYVKAASCSSSIGANIAFDRNELKTALKIAFSHHHKAIVEENIHGRDVSCIVYENENRTETSVLGEIVASNGTIDNNNNYILRTANFVYPADFPSETTEKIKHTAVKIYKVLGCKGFARIDFTVLGNDIYCYKAAIMPGFVREGIFAQLMQTSGFEYEELLDMLINNAYESRS